jgi:hypothetical protein
MARGGRPDEGAGTTPGPPIGFDTIARSSPEHSEIAVDPALRAALETLRPEVGDLAKHY